LYAALFLLLRPLAGLWGANALALAICTFGNTIAHGRVTFGSRRATSWRSQLAGSAVVFATTVALTSAALGVAVAAMPGAILPEVLAIVIGTALAAVVRFMVLKAWVFRAHISENSGRTPGEVWRARFCPPCVRGSSGVGHTH
jgi:putative flippase GtrA